MAGGAVKAAITVPKAIAQAEREFGPLRPDLDGWGFSQGEMLWHAHGYHEAHKVRTHLVAVRACELLGIEPDPKAMLATGDVRTRVAALRAAAGLGQGYHRRPR